MTYRQPTDLHPDLNSDYLEFVAALFARVRRGVRDRLQPDEGDDGRVFGYQSFVRSCFAIEKAALDLPWLKVLAGGRGEHFVFRIGAVPIRFYSGDPYEPSLRWFEPDAVERAAHQAAFQGPGFEYLAWMLRMTVKTDPVTGTTFVSLCRYGYDGQLLDTWRVRTPEFVANDFVVPLAEQRVGVELEPPSVEDPEEEVLAPERAGTANADE